MSGSPVPHSLLAACVPVVPNRTHGASVHEDLERLATIDTLDRSSHATRRRRDKARRDVTEASEAVTAAEAALARAEQALSENKTVERGLQRRLDEGRRHRGNALRLLETGQGDPAGAQRQLEKSTALIDELETELLEVLEVQDERSAAVEAATEALRAARARHGELSQALPGIEADAEAALAADAAARAPVYDELPSDVQSRYDSFRAKNKWAVARVVRDACNACYKVVQQQHVSDLKRGIIKPCMGCHRWLVVEEATG